MTIYRKSYRWARLARIAISLTAIALLTAGMIDYASPFTRAGEFLGRLQIVPAMAAGAVVWLSVWAAVTLAFGRVYCSSVCPVGTLSDVFSRISMSVKTKNGLRRVYRYSPPRNRLRLGILMITLIGMIVGIFTIASVLDPYSAYARILSLLGLDVTRHALDCVHRIAVVWLAFTVAVLSLATIIVAAMWRGRILCNTLCPAGTMLGLLSSYSLMRMDINTDLCTNCRACEYACKARCIDLTDHVVDASRCVMCLNCADVCPASAISYRAGRHTLSMPMMQSNLPNSMQTASPADGKEKGFRNLKKNKQNETIS